MHPVVISFYTTDTPYEEEAKRLIDSCRRFELEADIVGCASQGNWEKNCGMKPSFILEKLKAWNRPVLWVDADGVFLQRPDFNSFVGCDFSVRLNEFLPKKNASRVVSNTIFINNSQPAVALLERWSTLTEQALNCPQRTTEFWDQMALRDALEEFPELIFLPMPLKFSKIFDFDDLFISEQEVIIEHHQASRRFKHTFAKDHCCH